VTLMQVPAALVHCAGPQAPAGKQAGWVPLRDPPV